MPIMDHQHILFFFASFGHCSSLVFHLMTFNDPGSELRDTQLLWDACLFIFHLLTLVSGVWRLGFSLPPRLAGLGRFGVYLMLFHSPWASPKRGDLFVTRALPRRYDTLTRYESFEWHTHRHCSSPFQVHSTVDVPVDPKVLYGDPLTYVSATRPDHASTGSPACGAPIHANPVIRLRLAPPFSDVSFISLLPHISVHYSTSLNCFVDTCRYVTGRRDSRRVYRRTRTRPGRCRQEAQVPATSQYASPARSNRRKPSSASKRKDR